MKLLRYIFCMLLFFIWATAVAQSDSGISELMKERAQQKVAQMNDNISFMADPQKSEAMRNKYRSIALNLFIAEGEPYEDMDTINTGVKMETTSIYRKKPTRRLMKDYFSGLVSLDKRYSKVKIQTTKVNEIKISDLHKVADGLYVCTAYFEQIFIGYKDGIPIYKDRTRKKVKIYIKEDIVISDDGEERELEVLLGDVTALETTRI